MHGRGTPPPLTGASRHQFSISTHSLGYLGICWKHKTELSIIFSLLTTQATSLDDLTFWFHEDANKHWEQDIILLYQRTITITQYFAVCRYGEGWFILVFWCRGRFKTPICTLLLIECEVPDQFLALAGGGGGMTDTPIWSNFYLGNDAERKGEILPSQCHGSDWSRSFFNIKVSDDLRTDFSFSKPQVLYWICKVKFWKINISWWRNKAS